MTKQERLDNLFLLQKEVDDLTIPFTADSQQKKETQKKLNAACIEFLKTYELPIEWVASPCDMHGNVTMHISYGNIRVSIYGDWDDCPKVNFSEYNFKGSVVQFSCRELYYWEPKF